MTWNGMRWYDITYDMDHDETLQDMIDRWNFENLGHWRFPKTNCLRNYSNMLTKQSTGVYPINIALAAHRDGLQGGPPADHWRQAATEPTLLSFCPPLCLLMFCFTGFVTRLQAWYSWLDSGGWPPLCRPSAWLPAVCQQTAGCN